MADKKIKAMMLFEMIGKPKEYLIENLESYIKNIDSPGIKTLSSKIHECKCLETKDGVDNELFSTFAEVELEFDNLSSLFGIVIRMLPSHIEILEPSDLYLKNFDLGSVLSELAIKLHKYDEVVKVLMMERDHLAIKLNKANELLCNGVKVKEILNKDSDDVKEADKKESKISSKENKKKGKKK
jgi:hypothetical protein